MTRRSRKGKSVHKGDSPISVTDTDVPAEVDLPVESQHAEEDNRHDDRGSSARRRVHSAMQLPDQNENEALGLYKQAAARQTISDSNLDMRATMVHRLNTQMGSRSSLISDCSGVFERHQDGDHMHQEGRDTQSMQQVHTEANDSLRKEIDLIKQNMERMENMLTQVLQNRNSNNFGTCRQANAVEEEPTFSQEGQYRNYRVDPHQQNMNVYRPGSVVQIEQIGPPQRDHYQEVCQDEERRAFQSNRLVTQDMNPSRHYNLGETDNQFSDQSGLFGLQKGHERPSQHRHTNTHTSVKIPPFQGKDDWKVWINRFEAIANRHRWSDEEKLDRLLPCLQGYAADFVFTQLRKEALQNYRVLVNEINFRFRVVETHKTFAARFSRRDQHSNETAEEYAAELKCLYDKAHPTRDAQTRKEDLVRRFLDGLRDDDIRCDVEYIKEPADIDEAVYHAVNLIQTKRSTHGPYSDRRMKKVLRSTNQNVNEEADSSSECIRQSSVTDMPEKQESTVKNEPSKTPPLTMTGKEADVNPMLKQILEKINEIVLQPRDKPERRRQLQCFACGQNGHMARECQVANENRNTGGSKRFNGRYRNKQSADQQDLYHGEDRNMVNLNERGPVLMAKRRSEKM